MYTAKKTEYEDIPVCIFPAMRTQVRNIIDTAKTINKIKRIIIFGSAVTKDCGIGSDLDIAVDAPDADEDDFLKISLKLRRSVDVSTDIMHYNSIQSDILLDEINKKGVDVYVSGLQ